MFSIRKTHILCIALFAFFAMGADAQALSFNYLYSFQPTMFTEPPELGGLDVKLPETAIKNGVDGTAKASVVLGEDGKTREIQITQDLPFGVGDAITKALQGFYFKPAKYNGKPVPITMTVSYVISLEYGENDKNVDKVKILEKPMPAYPAKYAPDKMKGRVEVTVHFDADGKIKVLGVSSTMEREFDKAAAEAATHIKFQPAVHKKSKKPVNQQVTVVYEFKP